MNWPTVSVGIPTWNRAGWIRRSVSSVLEQDYPLPVEVVVADDGSTDETKFVIAHNFGSRVKYVPSRKHKGIAHAKNTALLNSSGEIRGLLDDDDWHEPQFVRRCVETLLENREVGLAYTDDVLVEDGVRTMAPALDWSLEELLETCNLRAGGWLAWWDALQRTNLHDERLESDEDYDLIYKLSKVTNLMRVPEPLHCRAQHSGCMTSQREKTTWWHAAVLAKHGFSVRYAYMRAHRHGAGLSWNRLIEEGYAFGETLR